MSTGSTGDDAGEETRELAGRVLALLRHRGETLAVAESCTGGLLGAALTSVPGSSDVFWGGVIAYADGAKRRLLGVGSDVLARDGAVSEEATLAMARGVRERSGADWSLSVTGIAGPGGGTPEKPVGTVWLGLAGPGEAGRGEARSRLLELSGTRAEIRRATVRRALEMLAERAGVGGREDG